MRKPSNLKEHLEKIKYYSNYNYIKEAHIREADDGLYDEIPNELFEDEEENPEMDAPVAGAEGDATAPEAPIDEPSPEEQGEEEDSLMDANVDIETPEPAPPQPSKDELQTQALRAQIEAMQKMSEKMDSLERTIQMMSGKVSELDADVEQVKEPQPIEKFNQRKQDSHPFYYGLNDMWNGNVFQARRDEMGEKGIVKLEDGSYIADFDDLPKYSSHELKNSF